MGFKEIYCEMDRGVVPLPLHPPIPLYLSLPPPQPTLLLPLQRAGGTTTVQKPLQLRWVRLCPPTQASLNLSEIKATNSAIPKQTTTHTDSHAQEMGKQT